MDAVDDDDDELARVDDDDERMVGMVLHDIHDV